MLSFECAHPIKGCPKFSAHPFFVPDTDAVRSDPLRRFHHHRLSSQPTAAPRKLLARRDDTPVWPLFCLVLFGWREEGISASARLHISSSSSSSWFRYVLLLILDIEASVCRLASRLYNLISFGTASTEKLACVVTTAAFLRLCCLVA